MVLPGSSSSHLSHVDHLMVVVLGRLLWLWLCSWNWPEGWDAGGIELWRRDFLFGRGKASHIRVGR